MMKETAEVNLATLLRKILKNHQHKDLVLIIIQIQIRIQKILAVAYIPS